MSDGGEKSISRTLKLLLETKNSMKQFITKVYSGLNKVFLKTYISESQNRQQIYWLPKKNEHAFIDLTGHRKHGKRVRWRNKFYHLLQTETSKLKLLL